MVSIHMNSADKTVTAKGAECWVHTKKPADSQKLAEDILKQLKSEAGFNDRASSTELVLTIRKIIILIHIAHVQAWYFSLVL